jgi:hypothetical protein
MLLWIAVPVTKVVRIRERLAIVTVATDLIMMRLAIRTIANLDSQQIVKHVTKQPIQVGEVEQVSITVACFHLPVVMRPRPVLLATKIIFTKAHRKIATVVIGRIMIRHAFQITDNLDFRPIVIVVTSLVIQIGIGRI